MKHKLPSTKNIQIDEMKMYYRFHSKIYDLTRWMFLFGRDDMLKKIPIKNENSQNILEIGCGTGRNLEKLARMYSEPKFSGIDVSADMIKKSKEKLSRFGKRIELFSKPYQNDSGLENTFDVIFFSYSLCMMNPYWEEIILQCKSDLKKGGYIAVVDFHDTKNEFYRDYMRSNYVKVDGHILPLLKNNFSEQFLSLKKGIFSFWEYMIFIGKKV